MKFPVAPEFDYFDGRTRLHVVFSTDCRPYQHWQSYALFFSALKVGQPGKVTRIASGCTEDEAEEAMKWHIENIQNEMSKKFKLHLTPDFSSITDENKKYSYFNKPFGLLHWLEHGEDMGINPNTKKLLDEDVVIILIDPDMLLLRPFSVDFSNKRETVFKVQHEEWVTKVQHGKPFSAKYGFGTKWMEFNLTEITGSTTSPAIQVLLKDAEDHYMVGPPYLATGRDMYAIAQKWTAFSPKVYKQYPHLLAEMFGYCIAASHLKLPHKIVKSLMLSDYGCAPSEGWVLVDALPAANICNFASNPNRDEYPVANVIHYCQTYNAGEWFFAKHQMATDFFTCKSPMMAVPPSTLGTVNYTMTTRGKKEDFEEKHVKRETFMLCGIISLMNDASEFFKSHSCNAGEGSTVYDKILRHEG